MSKPRTYTVRGRDSQDRVIVNGPFTSKDAARKQAEINVRQHGTSFRVSTRGQFGSFTVTPEEI